VNLTSHFPFSFRQQNVCAYVCFVFVFTPIISPFHILYGLKPYPDLGVLSVSTLRNILTPSIWNLIVPFEGGT
jgi:hypothetical protein